jgi:Ethanolamine utilization protein EutJ (predicted chaperonin)
VRNSIVVNFNLIGNLERQHKMATEKTFTVVGTATNPDGTTKARFANDLVARIKILNKAGCTNINLMELPTAMTKLEALQYLQQTELTGDAGYAVANKLAEKTKLAKKGEVKVKATGVKSAAKTGEAVTA